MRKLFRSQHKITQEFGVNKEYYSKFGLQGHEGLDLIPTGTDWTVYALEDGVVVKDEDNARSGAYGVYCTIWHPSINKATQYCHMEFNLVENGMQVKKGQAIGKMGSTGNSTGAHVHLNLFETDGSGTRLNKDNGFLGGINPQPFLEEDVQNPVQEGVNNDGKKAVQFDRITSFLNSISVLPTDRSEDYIDNDALVQGVRNLNQENQNKANLIDNLNTEVVRLNGEIADYKSQATTLNNKIAFLTEAQKQDAVDDNDLIAKNIDLEHKVTDLNNQIVKLKEEKAQPIKPIIDHYKPILKKSQKNLFKIKKSQSLKDKFWKWIS